jgi:uncharacterized protein YjbI with pentapeptide repeats
VVLQRKREPPGRLSVMAPINPANPRRWLAALRNATRWTQMRLGRSTSLMAAITRAVVLSALGIVLVALAVDWYVNREAANLTPADRAGVALDVLKVSGAVVAGLGAAVALTVSYRKQREEEARRDGERFEQAARQLGDADPAVRIAGAYALGRVADESAEYRPSIVQLLCAYLRVNRPDDTAVQQTICEILSARLVGSDPGETFSPGPWSDLPIDLHGVVFEEEVSFSACFFGARTRFDGAIFKRDANFVHTRFQSQTLFSDAEFQRLACFFFSEFQGAALFNGTIFRGMTAFNSSLFARGLQANNAKFIEGAGFRDARFLNGANFSGAEMGNADFGGTRFARGVGKAQSDAIHKGAAYFRGTKFEHASFDGARFEAAVHFDGAEFDDAMFDGIFFAGEVTVQNASFGTTMSPPAARPCPVNGK